MVNIIQKFNFDKVKIALQTINKLDLPTTSYQWLIRRWKSIAIFGSTGSIGTQALDVIRANPSLFEVEILQLKPTMNYW